MQRSTIMAFMNSSTGHHDNIDTFCSFFEKSISGIAPTLFTSVGEMHGFWLDPFFYILVRVWNNMITQNTDIRYITTDN